MAYKKLFLPVGAAIIVVFVLSLGAYRILHNPDPGDSARINELQAEIDGLQDKNAQAKVEIDKAKENAAKALERARTAQARADVFASQAAEWRQRYNLIAAERETLKRAQTGNEAVRELRKMGWVR